LRSQPYKQGDEACGIGDGDRRKCERNDNERAAEEGFARAEWRGRRSILPAPTHKNCDERGQGPYAEQREACRKAEIGIPDQKAEIVEGLAVILAADHARDRPVEIDLTAEGLGDLLAPHGDQRRAERDERDEDQQDAEDGTCAHGRGFRRDAACGRR
jgi:hypothetical protein